MEYPERQETWDESLDRCSRMPPPLFLLFPEALGRGPGYIFREICRDWEKGSHTSGLRSSESRLPRGKMAKWECREAEQTGRGRKEGWGQEAAGVKINRFRQSEEREALCRRGRKGERGSQEGPAIRSVLGLHIYTVEGVHRWALN